MERPCRSCGQVLRFERTATGKLNPINTATGQSHFADCPDRDRWRKPRTLKQVTFLDEPEPERPEYPR